MPTGFKIAELDASREEPEKGGWQDVADGAFTQENRNPFAPPRPKKPPKLAQKKVKARGHVQTHPEYPQIVHTNIPISSIHLAEHQERIVPPAGPVHARSSDSVRDKNRASYAASSANESVTSEAGRSELWRVERLILQAGYDFPDLRGQADETPEDAVARLLDQYRRLSVALRDSSQRSPDSRSADEDLRAMHKDLRAYKIALKDKQTKLTEAEAMLQIVRSKHEKEMEQRIGVIRELEHQMNGSAEEISRLQERQRSLMSDQVAATADRAKEGETLKKQINVLTLQNHELEASHGGRLRKEREMFDRELSGLKIEHEKQLNEVRTEIATKVRNEQQLHKKSLDNLHRQLNEEKSKAAKVTNALEVAEARLKEQAAAAQSELRKQTTDFTTALEHEEKKFDRDRHEYENHIRNLREQLREATKTQEERRVEEQQRLHNELRKQEDALREQHEAEQFQLRSTVEDFKLALVAKEHFKGMTDAELTSRFNKLAQDVEDFARIEWDPIREAEWWRYQLQQLHPRNIRKLKQKMVQNSLWIQLREHIFRSPFKLFAEQDEWKELDKMWVDIYSGTISATQWPELPREIEKLRYEHAKQWRAAMDASAKPGAQDRLAQLKSIYETLVASLVNTIAGNIGKVANIQEKDRRALHKIVRNAAELWLECCSQRYRLIFTLVDGIEDILGLSQGNIRIVKLALKPELRRFGTAHGDNVMKEELVVGWRSEVEVFSSPRLSG